MAAYEKPIAMFGIKGYVDFLQEVLLRDCQVKTKIVASFVDDSSVFVQLEEGAKESDNYFAYFVIIDEDVEHVPSTKLNEVYAFCKGFEYGIFCAVQTDIRIKTEKEKIK